MENGNITVEYDNRFGFAKYCTATWIMNSQYVGEVFDFNFPNGICVTVARNTPWCYSTIPEGQWDSSTRGFRIGKYELLVHQKSDGFFHDEIKEEAGYLDHKQVRQFLSRWRNHRP